MLELDPNSREKLWKDVSAAVETYFRELESLPVSPSMDPSVPRERLADVDFGVPMTQDAALALVLEGLRNQQVHNGHPRYFGLFNPATTTMSIAADTLVAAFNPQLAAWTHAPFACEVEQRMIREIGERFGYPPDATAGSFTTGGTEANHTALLMALMRRFPELSEEGAQVIRGRPVLYVSPESHHSFLKAARHAGIGTRAVRTVSVDDGFRLDADAVERMIVRDRKAGDVPFMVIATLGTTGAGLVDPVGRLADVSERHGLWLHADAAWGGAAALLPEMRHIFHGIERSDSITFDAHKWLGVPMGAGMFFTRHPEMPERTFGVDAGYMPRAKPGVEIVEPHRTSMQWTRRFIGLKLFFTCLVHGWQGYEETIREMIRLGDVLRRKLEDAGWNVVNRTPLPVVCFQDGSTPKGASASHLEAIARAVVSSGGAWISTTMLGGTIPAIRACITNFRNREEDIDALIDILRTVRDKEMSSRERSEEP